MDVQDLTNSNTSLPTAGGCLSLSHHRLFLARTHTRTRNLSNFPYILLPVIRSEFKLNFLKGLSSHGIRPYHTSTSIFPKVSQLLHGITDTRFYTRNVQAVRSSHSNRSRVRSERPKLNWRFQLTLLGTLLPHPPGNNTVTLGYFSSHFRSRWPKDASNLARPSSLKSCSPSQQSPTPTQ